MGDVFPKIRIAAVQAAPVFLNREASVEKACRLIREAGANGARVIGFPEGFIPAHPVWYYFEPFTSQKAINFSTQLFLNSVEIPSPATDALCQAAREASAYVVMGVCEKLPGTTGTMFNTQIFIDRTGRILGKHQKLVPTVAERLVHCPGYDAAPIAFETEYGPISGLLCGENSNPLAVFAYIAQNTRIHVSSWPHLFFPGFNPMKEASILVGQALAYQAKAFVINACGTIDEEMLRVLPANEQDAAGLRNPEMLGGSTIINTSGRIIAGPMGPEEGILYADVDLGEAVRNKLVHDFAGHYNRRDVFQVTVNTASSPLYNPTKGPLTVVETPAATPAAQPDGNAPVDEPKA